jgi:hypothetical protein
MNTLGGTFFFKITDSGNIIGEFSNSDCDRTYTESADRTLPHSYDGKFTGSYITTWQENEEPQLSHLTILPKNGHKVFSLEWKDKHGKSMFTGEGILCDNILIGNYQGAK